MYLSPEDNLILSCVKIHPTEAELACINNLILNVKHWDYLKKCIIERGIAPLLYVKLPVLSNSSKIPEHVITSLKKTYYLTLSRSVKLHEAFRNIAEAFTRERIPFVALKGIYLSEWLYKDIGLRQISDIDLLIHEEDSNKCFSILDDLGYYPFDGIESELIGGQHDLMHYKPRVNENEISVELHIRIQHRNVEYNMPIEEIWHNSNQVRINEVDFRVLNFNDNLVYLILHLDKHFRGGHIQFTCFNDVTNILTEYADNINWNELIEISKKYNCESLIFKYIILVDKYFHIHIPDFIQHIYNYLLKHDTEKMFIKYLRGYSRIETFVPGHLSQFKEITSITKKIQYILKIIFPSRLFMIEKYRIKNNFLVLFYYPYRYYIGLKGLFEILKIKR